MLSIITPCYNEEETVKYFYKEVMKYLPKIDDDYEIIFVNDGSKDNTVEECLKLKKRNKKIHIVNFSRNFGKEAAMLAGLRQAKGDLVVLMDTDLQDPPALLPEMYNAIKKDGYDSVATYRVTRKGEPPIRSFFARCFYKLINMLIEVQLVDGARDYRMMTRTMVDAILSMSEYHRFTKGIFAWVGFRTKYMEYENVERIAGETKWSFWKLFKYAIEGIVAFTTLPLRLPFVIGILNLIIGFVMGIINLATSAAYDHKIMATIIFLSGILFVFMGIMGEYLAKTYMETKRRPVYIVKEVL